MAVHDRDRRGDTATRRHGEILSAIGVSLCERDAATGGRGYRARTGGTAFHQRGRSGAARPGTAQRRDEDAGGGWRAESAAANPPARCAVDGGARGAAGGSIIGAG